MIAVGACRDPALSLGRIPVVQPADASPRDRCSQEVFADQAPPLVCSGGPPADLQYLRPSANRFPGCLVRPGDRTRSRNLVSLCAAQSRLSPATQPGESVLRRNDPALQHETRDQAAIERELAAVPGPEAWRPTAIDLDGIPTVFQRQDRAGDWIAFREFGDECVWVHVEQPSDAPVALVTVTDIAPYLDAN